MSRSEGRRARRRPSRPDPSEETAVWLAELEQLADRDHRADDEEWARTLRSRRSGMTGEYPAQPQQPPPPPPYDHPSSNSPGFDDQPAPTRQEWPPAPPAQPPSPADFGWLNPPLSPAPLHPLGDPGGGFGSDPSNGFGSGVPGGDPPPPSATGSGMDWNAWDQGSGTQAAPGHSPAPWDAGYGQAAYGDTGSLPAQAPPPTEPWQPGYQAQEPSSPWPAPSSTGQFPAASTGPGSGTGQFPAVPPAPPRQPEPWEPAPSPPPPPEPEPWAGATAGWSATEPARAPEPPREQPPRWPDDGLTADTGAWRPDPGRWTDQPWNPPRYPPQAPTPTAGSPVGAAAPTADSHPTLPVTRLQPPPFAEPPVARRTPPRAAPGADDEQVVALGGYRPGTPAGDPMPPPTEERWRPPQAPSRASPPPSPSWRRGGRPGAGFVDDDEAAAFGRYAGPGGRGRGGGRPAWPRIIALASWIILLMVLCWFYVFPWLEHVLPANF
jgi:hypothetical protein